MLIEDIDAILTCQSISYAKEMTVIGVSRAARVDIGRKDRDDKF